MIECHRKIKKKKKNQRRPVDQVYQEILQIFLNLLTAELSTFGFWSNKNKLSFETEVRCRKIFALTSGLETLFTTKN